MSKNKVQTNIFNMIFVKKDSSLFVVMSTQVIDLSITTLNCSEFNKKDQLTQFPLIEHNQMNPYDLNASNKVLKKNFNLDIVLILKKKKKRQFTLKKYR